MKRLAIGLIRLYQRGISRFLPQVCRFQPTCSSYAIQALETHGFLRGGWLAVKRVCRCHPFSAGGADPVPPAHKHPVAKQRTNADDQNGDIDGRNT